MISLKKKKREKAEIKLLISCHCVCETVGGDEWEGEKEGTRKSRGRKREMEWDGGMPLLGSRTCRAHER